MPFYNFKCSNEQCGEAFDDLVKMGTTEVECTKCKQPAHKTIDSYKFVSTGLPNGHNGARATKVKK